MATSSSKALPLSQEQKHTLAGLVSEKPAINDKSHGLHAMNEKARAWKDVTLAFNLNFPLAEAKTERQLRRAWEYIKLRAKKQHGKHVRQKFGTGGGPAPASPPKEDALVLASQTIAGELALAENQVDTLDEDIIVVDAADVELISEEELDSQNSTAEDDPTSPPLPPPQPQPPSRSSGARPSFPRKLQHPKKKRQAALHKEAAYNNISGAVSRLEAEARVTFQLWQEAAHKVSAAADSITRVAEKFEKLHFT